MARLNEPPIATAPLAENNDAELVAVKRKFLRQNRELAKTNSQQSIRIRTLENDASRLLAENLSLREQVVQLQNTLEAQSQRPSFDDIDGVKDRLETKMQELESLVAELGLLNKKPTVSPRCKDQVAATRKSPDERQWRSGLGLQEVENAMLPTITEGKLYPRKTLNADELDEVDDSQSPDIGPPPVSRFTNEEPISFNPSRTSEVDPDSAIDEGNTHLLGNLETRRKRRESGPQPRCTPPSESPSAHVVEDPQKTLRTGAKRKFSVQEDEEKSKALAEPFHFSRKNTPASTDNTVKDDQSHVSSTERRALGSKPVNTDPVISPKKPRPNVTDKPEKKVLAKTNRSRLTITRNIQPVLPPIEMSVPISTTEIILDSLPPNTPAPEDIPSPPSTEPSTSRPESKDTPPPGDLALGSQGGIGSRPSRRVRAQVSYKEPSLNTKMRRPGKELVDAVVSDQHRRTSGEPQTALSATGPTSLPQEHSGSAWKPLGVISERNGEEDGEVGSPLRQKLDRREGSQDGKVEAPRLNSAAASHAISAMIEETKRKSVGSHGLSSSKVTFESPISTSQACGDEGRTLATKSDKKEDPAIFDFNESSPPTAIDPPVLTMAVASSRPRIDLAKAARSARRHSAVHTAKAPGTVDERVDSHKKPDSLPSVHKKTGSGVTRSSSASNLVSEKSTGAAREKEKGRRDATKIAISTSSVDLAGQPEGGVPESTRGERAASRRRSMML